VMLRTVIIAVVLDLYVGDIADDDDDGSGV
jgi:hypothetical protein